MNILRIALFALIGIGITAPAWAEEPHHKPYIGSKAFQRMTQMVGHWQVTMDMGKGPQTMKASYKLTSGGSALVETLFEGTPMEMVNIYHDNSKGTLHMIHFCAGHNQPVMSLVRAQDKTLSFDLTQDADIDAAHEGHMHSLLVSFDNSDHVTQQWLDFKNGKKDHITQIKYQRVK